jgi:hypothetical protein
MKVTSSKIVDCHVLESIGVYYLKPSDELKSFYRKYKNNYIFCDQLDQFSFFLCDRFFVEDQSFIKAWRELIDVYPISEWKDFSEGIKSFDKKRSEEYLNLKKSFLENFSSSPVDLYSSLSSKGRSHLRKYKKRGLFVPKDDYKDSLIKLNDVGLFFRECSKLLVHFAKGYDLSNFIFFSSKVLEFCRLNFLIKKNPFYLFGINLCIYKSIKLMGESSEFDKSNFFTTSKKLFNAENQPDIELIIFCYSCVILKLESSVSFASLFLNSLFIMPEFSLVDSNLQLDQLISISSKEKELILNHANIIAKTYEDLKLGDINFTTTIKQHHGSVTGKGFVDSFRSSISESSINFMALQKIIQSFIELRPNESMSHSVGKVKENIISTPMRDSVDQIFSEIKNLFSNC